MMEFHSFALGISVYLSGEGSMDTIVAVTDNPTLIPLLYVIYDTQFLPAPKEATLVFAPGALEFGTAQIDVLVTDSYGQKAEKSFTVQVTQTPKPCSYSDYSAWSRCSQPCSTGIQSRTRTVLSEAQGAGTPCDETSLTQVKTCNTQMCKKPSINGIPGRVHDTPGQFIVPLTGIDGQGDLVVVATSNNPSLIPNPEVEWTPGSSTGSLSYLVLDNLNKRGGEAIITVFVNQPAFANSPTYQTQTEFRVTIPATTVDCWYVFSGPFGPCSKECGGGEHSRTATILTRPTADGLQCPDPLPVEVDVCNMHPCPGDDKEEQQEAEDVQPVVACALKWSEWGACEAPGLCGSFGKQIRIQEIKDPETSVECPMLETQSRSCVVPCPAESSCKGLCATGGMNIVGKCWCDVDCATYNDCCEDYALVCSEDDSDQMPEPNPSYEPSTGTPSSSSDSDQFVAPSGSCAARCDYRAYSRLGQDLPAPSYDRWDNVYTATLFSKGAPWLDAEASRLAALRLGSWVNTAGLIHAEAAAVVDVSVAREYDKHMRLSFPENWSAFVSQYDFDWLTPDDEGEGGRDSVVDAKQPLEKSMPWMGVGPLGPTGLQSLEISRRSSQPLNRPTQEFGVSRSAVMQSASTFSRKLSASRKSLTKCQCDPYCLLFVDCCEDYIDQCYVPVLNTVPREIYDAQELIIDHDGKFAAISEDTITPYIHSCAGRCGKTVRILLHVHSKTNIQNCIAIVFVDRY